MTNGNGTGDSLRQVSVFLPVCALVIVVLLVWADFWSATADDNSWFGMAWAYFGVLLTIVALGISLVVSLANPSEPIPILAIGFVFVSVEMLALQVGQSLYANVNKFIVFYRPCAAGDQFVATATIPFIVMVASALLTVGSLGSPKRPQYGWAASYIVVHTVALLGLYVAYLLTGIHLTASPCPRQVVVVALPFLALIGAGVSAVYFVRHVK